MKKLLLLALIGMASFPFSAEALPGALDPSFGRGGKTAKPVKLGRAWKQAATAIAQHPEGGTIALAGSNLISLDRDGTLKRPGLIPISPPLFASQTLVDMAIDREGRIVVVGTASFPAESSRQWFQSDESVVVTRFTPRGSRDRTFGEDGFLVTDLGTEPPPIEPSPGSPMEPPAITRGAGVAIDAQGRIVLSGVGVDRIGPCQLGNHTRDFYLHKVGLVARLGENGDLDPSFGDKGLVTIPKTHSVQAPLLTRSGDALLFQDPEPECWNPSRKVVRVTPQGALDAGFSNWEAFETGPSSLALDRRGGVVVLWEDEETVWRGEGRDTMDGVDAGFVSRLGPNGTLVRSFGRKGVATVMLSRREFHPSQVLVDGRDRIYVVGAVSPKSALDLPGSLLLTRLDSEGDLDRRFGREGWAEVRWGREAVVKRTSAAFVGNGRVAAAGVLFDPLLKHDTGVGFARFLTR